MLLDKLHRLLLLRLDPPHRVHLSLDHSFDLLALPLDLLHGGPNPAESSNQGVALYRKLLNEIWNAYSGEKIPWGRYATRRRTSR
jgi:hypothetical protein